MKRSLSLFVALALSLTACGAAASNGNAAPSAAPPVALASAPSTTIPPASRPSPPPRPSPSAQAPAAHVGDRVVVANRQALTVLGAEAWNGMAPPAGHHFIAVLVELEGIQAAPFNATFFTISMGTGTNRVANRGKPPRFSQGATLLPGATYRAWLTFSVPVDCSCQVVYSLPVGQGGNTYEPIRVELTTIGPATPDATPAPRPTRAPGDLPEVLAIRASFFGPGAEVVTYRVDGSTPAEIAVSMSRNGPYLAWLGGRAEALTASQPEVRYSAVAPGAAQCRIIVEATPPILYRFTIVLPRWTPPPGTAAATVEWWNTTLLELATHERTHVEIYRAAEAAMNEAVSSVSCPDVDDRLDALLADVNRQQCEFDMREYGFELGLSLEECIRG